MRVLHVTQGYAPAIGGTERAIQRVSEELVRQFDDEVTVFTTNRYSAEGFVRSGLPELPVGWEEREQVRVRRFAVRSEISRLLERLQDAAYRRDLPFNDRLRTWYNGPIIPGLRRAICSQPADVIAASSFPLLHMFDALRAARRSGRPCVLIGGLHPDDRWSSDRKIIDRAIHQADLYIAYTGYEAEHVIRRGADPRRVVTIGVGVDPEPFCRLRPEEAKRALGLQGKRVVGFIGQLGVHKGVDTLIFAMRHVLQSVPEAHLLVAGARTSFAAHVEKIIAGCPPEERGRITLLLDFEESRKPELFGALDAFVYPSAFESFGLTFLEAWAAGKPVIGCERGAVGWVIDAGSDGLLVPYRDERALAEAILLLLQNPEHARAMGEAGRRKTVARFTWPVVARDFRQAYLRAAREHEQRAAH